MSLERMQRDAAGLASDLREVVRGEVRFDDGSRALYATDASNYRQTPIGVVVPRDEGDIVLSAEIARRYGAPLLLRGCGTSLAGQCCNAALVLDTSKYLNRVLDIDPKRRRARVQPGVILDDLIRLAAPSGLTFGPDPATHNHCTLGGMIGNNSCGIHAVQSEFYGPGTRMEDNVEELEVLTYDGLRLGLGPTPEEEIERIVLGGGRRGEIYRRLRELRDRYAPLIRERFPDIPRRVSGYNLPQLLPENGFNLARALVGSESTCAVVLEAAVTLIPNPSHRALLVVAYSSVYEAADHVPLIREHRPLGLEGIDDRLVGYMRKKGLHPDHIALLPPGGGWLLVETGGDNRRDAAERSREIMEALRKNGKAPAMRIFEEPDEQEKIWEIRESGLGATAFVPGERDTWPGWEDSAVAPERLGDYLRDLRALFEKYGYQCSLYGHFGQGCVHVRIDFDLTEGPGTKKYLDFTREAAEIVVGRYGGSLSGEHGDGQSRADLLPVMFGGEIIEAFREFKSIWDPEGKMNPGKVIDPYPRGENLRLRDQERADRPITHFRYPEDGGDFAHAALRCVGVGKCRRLNGGTMCPSFMVTREEKHTTRGRARLLFEMLNGDVVGGWRSEAVKEALDLCLACKGCKGDCPVSVDMATYKAEFLAHYYQGRLRPRSAYAFGLIYWWTRFFSRMPPVANFFTQTPGLSAVAKAVAGVASQRRIPTFAPETFAAWFARRPPKENGESALLWPDTFNNYFQPENGRAAVEIMEAAGFQVRLPRVSLCCGRPLYDYGMLASAKNLLGKILDALEPELAAGVPIVVLEPSCAAVFRDELGGLFSQDERAGQLRRQTFLLSEFLEKKAPDFKLPQCPAKALIQGHCHQKAVMGTSHDQAVYAKLGLDAFFPDAGCCGMAGSFGFEKGERYEVSIKSGERVLLPAVRNAPRDTLIIADGFSCREQIAQATERRALHTAQVIQMALGGAKRFLQRRPPEASYVEQRKSEESRANRRAAIFFGAMALAGGALAWSLRGAKGR